MDDITRAFASAMRDSKRSRRSRAGRWVARLAGRAAWWVTKKTTKGFVKANVRFWVALAPFQAAVFLWALSAVVCHVAPGAWRTLAIVLALGAVAPYWFCGLPFPMSATTRTGFAATTVKAITRTPRLSRRAIAWIFSGYATASILAVVGAIVGPGIRHGDPIPGLWLIWAGAFGWPWWWAWHAIRTPEVRALADADERLALWASHGLPNTEVFNPAAISRILPGELVPSTSSRTEIIGGPLAGPVPTVIGWQVSGVMTRGKGGASKLVGMTEDVAALFETSIENVAIEPAQGNARRFTVSVFTHNPLRIANRFPGPAQVFSPLTGIAVIGGYADCGETLYRFYKRFSGPVHDLISGTSDAGKSRLIEMLLTVERRSPLMASVVIDPQAGQSLPAFKSTKGSTVHRTAGFATDFAQGLLILILMREEMYARNALLAETPWVDVDEETGEEFDEEGVDSFDPLEGPTAGMVLIVLTIDEAHMILKNAIAAALVEDIAKMARKCGIKLRLATQVPLLDQLGGSTTLRDMVAAGNVVVFRTANALSGQVAFNGALPVDPKTLPREWEVEREDGTIDRVTTAGLGYALGPGARPVPFRTFLNDKVRSHARAGETTEIQLTAYRDRGWTLNDFLTAFRGMDSGQAHPGITPRILDLFTEYLPEKEAAVFAASAAAFRAPAGSPPANGASPLLPAAAEYPGDWELVEAFLQEREARGEAGASKEVIRQGTGLPRQNVDTVIRRRDGRDGKAAQLHASVPGRYALGPAPAAEADVKDVPLDPIRALAGLVMSGVVAADDKTTETLRLAMEAEAAEVVEAAELERRSA